MVAKTKVKRKPRTIKPQKEKKNEVKIEVQQPEETAIEVSEIVNCNFPLLRSGTENFKNEHFGIRKGVQIRYAKKGCETAELTAEFKSENSSGRLWEVSGTIHGKEIEPKTLTGLVETELYCYSLFRGIPWEGKKETRKKLQGSFLGFEFLYPYEINSETKYVKGKNVWEFCSGRITEEKFKEISVTI